MFIKSFVTFFGSGMPGRKNSRTFRASGTYTGNPLTPIGYAIVAVTVAAFALVAMLCTSSVGNELGRSLRLSWWFS
jgi:hypothetical protein